MSSCPGCYSLTLTLAFIFRKTVVPHVGSGVFKHIGWASERKILRTPVLEEIQESHHKLLDILHTLSSMRIAIQVNEALMEPSKTVWQTLATTLPTSNRVDKNYYVPDGESEFLFSRPALNSLVVDAVNERGRQHSSSPPHTARTIRGSNFLAASPISYNYIFSTIHVLQVTILMI